VVLSHHVSGDLLQQQLESNTLGEPLLTYSSTGISCFDHLFSWHSFVIHPLLCLVLTPVISFSFFLELARQTSGSCLQTEWEDMIGIRIELCPAYGWGPKERRSVPLRKMIGRYFLKWKFERCFVSCPVEKKTRRKITTGRGVG